MNRPNRRWLLTRRPEGRLSLDNFTFDAQPFTPPSLKPGEILVGTRIFSCAPTMRNFMNAPGRSYRASVNLGDPVIGVAGGVVLASEDPDWPVGTRLTGMMRWCDYVVLHPAVSPTPVMKVPEGTSFEQALGVFGLNALTGYMGMTRVGQPKAGETVVVSAAAGSTGSVAAQVARNLGCRVIGIAGGPEKCARLTAELGLHAAIDYKNEDVTARLAELAPDGVDVFFDNVGGDILQAVMDNIARKGRIAVCGQVSAYDSDSPAPGPRDMMKVVYWQVRVQGFVLGDYAHEAAEGLADLRRWHAEGRLHYRLDLRQGFENLPASFLDLFTGANDGGLLVLNDNEAAL